MLEVSTTRAAEPAEVLRLVAALDDLEVVALDCPPRLVGFYEGVGLRVSANTRLERVRGDGTGRPD